MLDMHVFEQVCLGFSFILTSNSVEWIFYYGYSFCSCDFEFINPGFEKL